MKPLNEYPTPETDIVYNTKWGDGTPETLASIMIDHAESLERRLAACREALEKCQACDGYDPMSVEIMQDAARETLAATAKP